MMQLLAFALSWIGFLALALSMERHYRQVWGRAPSASARLLLRAAGAGGLGASLAACLADSGWTTGVLLWLGLLPVASLTIALLFAYRHRLTRLAKSSTAEKAVLRRKAGQNGV